jgi:ankyrin repeat protein
MYWAIYHQENDRVAAMLDAGEDPNVRWLKSTADKL